MQRRRMQTTTSRAHNHHRDDELREEERGERGGPRGKNTRPHHTETQNPLPPREKNLAHQNRNECSAAFKKASPWPADDVCTQERRRGHTTRPPPHQTTAEQQARRATLARTKRGGTHVAKSRAEMKCFCWVGAEAHTPGGNNDRTHTGRGTHTGARATLGRCVLRAAAHRHGP